MLGHTSPLVMRCQSQIDPVREHLGHVAKHQSYVQSSVVINTNVNDDEGIEVMGVRPKCVSGGCSRSATKLSDGLCAKHRAQTQAVLKNECARTGCHSRIYNKDGNGLLLCFKDYRAFLRTGKMYTKPRKKASPICVYNGCTRPKHPKRTLCTYHWNRWIKAKRKRDEEALKSYSGKRFSAKERSDAGVPRVKPELARSA